MGAVVNFVARTDRVRRAAPARGTMPACEIIILPCIRYERWTDDAAKPMPQKKKKSKAKRRTPAEAVSA